MTDESLGGKKETGWIVNQKVIKAKNLAWIQVYLTYVAAPR